MNDNDRISTHRISRRRFLAGSAGVAAAALLPGGRVFAAADPDGLRIRRLAWAGIRLQLPKATLFIDPLVNPAHWGPALGDPLVPVGDAVGDAYVLVLEGDVEFHCQLYAPLTLARGDAVYFDAAAGYALVAPQRPARALLVASGEAAFGR